MGFLCVSVDLDEVRSYCEIHGLAPPPPEAAAAVYDRALPRAARFLEKLGIPGTFFAVGRDLEAATRAGDLLRDLAGRGCEVANHTMSHRYDLTLLGSAEQAAEIDRGAEAIREAVGVSPRGFRAPGYNVHLELLDLLAERGYEYDSSVFPCPAYWAAKAGAIGAKRLAGRESSSILGDPRILVAPVEPYRVGRDGVWTRGSGIREIPITVVTRLRIPFIGTSLVMAGRALAALLSRAAARTPVVNLELHGIDFADADGDGLGFLAGAQPDLRVSLTRKLEILERAIGCSLDRGAEPMTLADAARRFFV